MKFRYKITVIVLLALAAFTYLIYSFIYWQKRVSEKQAEKQANCQYLNQDRYGGFVDPVDFIDCFGIFSIEHDSPLLGNKRLDLYYIRDDKHDYNISILDTLKHYKIFSGIMYIYEPVIFPEEEYTHIRYGEKPWQYPQKFFMDGAVKEINYASPNDFPKYIQVETSTGEVTLYNTYDQMPEEAKLIFQELENNAISESS